jgi:hypothetical protein
MARTLVVDPAIYTSQERALHEQAARTMAQFQAGSRDVYATVPQFAPPALSRTLSVGPEEPPQPPPAPRPPDPRPPIPVRPPVPHGGGGGPVTGGGPGTPGGSPGRTPAAPLPPGGGAGTAEPATRPAAASAPVPARQGTQPPMGGGAGGRGNDDVERKNKYVEEDPEIWGVHDQRVMPPVIGEVNRRA